MSVVERLILRDDASPALQRAGSSAERAGRRFQISARQVAAVGAAMAAAAASAFKLAQRFADATNDVNDLAGRVGLLGETVLGLRAAAGGAGVSMGALESAVRGLQMRMSMAEQGQATAVRAFDALGVSLTDAAGKARTTESVLRDVSRELGRIQDPGERARRALETMGRAGGSLMQALGGGELEEFVEFARVFGTDVGPAASAAASDWQRSMSRLRTLWEGFASSVGRLVASVLQPAMESVALGAIAVGVGIAAAFSAAREEVAALIREVKAEGGFMRALGERLGVTSVGPVGGIDMEGLVGSGGLGGEAGGTSPETLAERMRRIMESVTSAVDTASAAWLAGRPGGAIGQILGTPEDVEEGAKEIVDAARELNAELESVLADRLTAENAYHAASTQAAQAAARAQRDSYLTAFGSILGAAQSFAGESLALHQALGLAQVAVSTAIGVMRAIEQYGPTPVGIAAAAAVGAAGVAQAAAIASAAMGRGPGGASVGGGGSGSVSEAVFAPAGEQGATSEASMGGGSTRQSRAIRVETVGGWARVRDFFDELERVGVTLRLEGA